MGKKVICFIASGITGIVLLMYLMTMFMAIGNDWKAFGILLLFIFPFIILGLIGGLILDRKKVLAGIFMILSGIATVFTGLMCCSGGMKYLGILALPLGFIGLILYIISAILTFIKK